MAEAKIMYIQRVIVSDVAEWLGVSKGRRQPRLFAIKLGPAKGKGLWKFREEDVHQFIQDQRRR
jgi:hypothetical protein